MQCDRIRHPNDAFGFKLTILDVHLIIWPAKRPVQFVRTKNRATFVGIEGDITPLNIISAYIGPFPCCVVVSPTHRIREYSTLRLRQSPFYLEFRLIQTSKHKNIGQSA